MKIRVIIAAVLICGTATITGWSEDTELTEELSKPDVFVGAGAVISSKPYKGVDPKIYPVPMFGYEGERLYLRGVGGGYRLFKKGGFSLGPVLQPRFDGYDSGDSSDLAGMDDRDWTVDGGIGLNWLTDYGLIGLSCVTDLLGKHDGQEVELSYTALFSKGGFDFVPSVGLRYKTDNLVDYYYGVKSDEARPGRPAYKPDNAMDPFIRLAVRRKLVGKWSLLGAVQCEWFDSEIKDSPIVDQSQDISFVAGVLYSW